MICPIKLICKVKEFLGIFESTVLVCCVKRIFSGSYAAYIDYVAYCLASPFYHEKEHLCLLGTIFATITFSKLVLSLILNLAISYVIWILLDRDLYN